MFTVKYAIARLMNHFQSARNTNIIVSLVRLDKMKAVNNSSARDAFLINTAYAQFSLIRVM